MASSFTPVDDIIQVDPSTLPPFPLHTQMNKLQINTYESPSRPQIAQISFQPQPNNYPLYYQTQPPWQQHVLPISYVPVTVTHNPNVSSPKAPFTLPLSLSTPLHMPNTSWHHSQPSTSSMPYNNPISVTTSDNHKLENFYNRSPHCSKNYSTTLPTPPPPPKWRKKKSLTNKQTNPFSKSAPADRVWAEHSYAKRPTLPPNPSFTPNEPTFSTNHSSGFSIFETKSSYKQNPSPNIHSNNPTCDLICFNCESITFHKTSFCPYRPFCRLCNNHHHRGLKSLCKGTTWDPFSTSQKTNVTKHKKGKINNNNNTSNNNL